MSTTRNQLIQQVALRMDEITPSSALSSITVDGADNNPLYELIDGLIDSGTLELFSVAPYFRLPQAVFSESDIALATVGTPRVINENQTIGQRNIIRLKVGNDFLRVAEINCPDFQRPITEVFPEQSMEGRRQHNPFLIAKEARPVGVMSYGSWTTIIEHENEEDEVVTENCREIDCYSLDTNTTVTVSDVSASYIAKPATIADTVESVVPPVLIPALEWLIAARTFGARGDSNHAEICQNNAQALLV